MNKIPGLLRSEWSKMLYTVIENEEKSIVFTQDCRIFQTEKEGLDDLVQKVKETELVSKKVTDLEQFHFNKKRMKKLILLMTTSCNLRCRYCYIDYGSYESVSCSGNIDVEKTSRSLKKLYNDYPEGIGFVQFFGGEPLIAFNEIKRTVEIVEQLCEEHKCKLPSYGIVTNGLLLTDEIVEYLEKKNIATMISLDGDKQIHDLVRKGIGGINTYDNLVMKIKSYINRIHCRVFFEMTLNREHIKVYQKGKMIELFEGIKALGFRAGNIGVVEFSKDSKLDFLESDHDTYVQMIDEMVTYFFDQMKTENPMFNVDVIRILTKILKKDTTIYSCGAGVSQVTLAADGAILPCPKFINTDFGIIEMDENEWDNSKIKDVVLNEYKSDCAGCWFNQSCNVYCYAKKYRGNEGEHVVPIRCWHIRALARSIVKNVVRMKQNNEMQILYDALKLFKIELEGE